MRRLLPESLIEAVREAGRALPGGVAAFDADGTLWRDDVGEAFLKHLVATGLVRLADGTDPYHRYEELCARDRAVGFAFCAQVQAGLHREQLEQVARDFAKDWIPSRLIASTQALLALCRESNLIPQVVSASPIEIVRAAAPLAGLPLGSLIGMSVEVDASGVLTDRIAPPIIYAEGKVESLRLRGLHPIALACGDSVHGDLAMLRAARVAVVVAPESGSALATEGHRRGWAILSPNGLAQQ